MSETQPNWSELLKNERVIVQNDWPIVAAASAPGNLKNIPLPQQVVAKRDVSPTSNISESLQKLELTPENNSEYNKVTDIRTREQILAERKMRKNQQRQQKAVDAYLKKLTEIREPKTDKLKVIASVDKQKFDQQNRSPAVDSSAVKRLMLPVARRATTIEVNLLDLVAKQPIARKKSRRDGYRKLRHTQPLTVIKRHKGKKREIPKQKWLSRLKKSILQARQLRLERCADVAVKLTDICREIAETQPTKEERFVVIPSEEQQKVPALEPACGGIQFTRKFRSYCNNFVTDTLCTLTEALLRDLFRFQDRAYQKNEIKARANRRYVVGFKETQRQLNIFKVKLLIIAPDLEKADGPDGIDEVVHRLMAQCTNDNVPYVFSLKRRKIGWILHKKVPVSCVGILSWDGSETNVEQLLPVIERERFGCSVPETLCLAADIIKS